MKKIIVLFAVSALVLSLASAAQAQIDSYRITASSTDTYGWWAPPMQLVNPDGYEPQNTVPGTFGTVAGVEPGLGTVPGSSADYPNELHGISYNSDGCFDTSGDATGTTAWIKFDLGQNYKLDQLRVWNGDAFRWDHTAGSYSAKQTDLYYSSVAGDPGDDFNANWTVIGTAGALELSIPVGTGTGSGSGGGTDTFGVTDEIALNDIDARWFAMKVNSTYGQPWFKLAEVQFISSFNSVGNGDWDATATDPWDHQNLDVPTVASPVNIKAGHTVTVNAGGASKELNVDGTLGIGLDAAVTPITVTNAMTLSGTAALALKWEGNGTFGGTSTIATYDSQTGTFATTFMANGGTLDASAYITDVTYGANEVTVTLADLIPGDADCNGKVNVLNGFAPGDASILTTNLGTATGATWFDGDFDGNGKVNVLNGFNPGDASILTSNLGTVLDVGDDAAAGTVEMLYDPATGEVFFDVGSGIGIFGLAHAELINGVVSPWFTIDASQDDVDAIAWFASSALPEGEASIGLVLPAGLDPATLGWVYQPVGGDLTPLTGATEVPEPGTMLLLLAAASSLLVWRRRRA